MAFTDAQKTDIRRFLGYPSLWRYRDTRLESVLDLVGDDPSASAVVVAKLAAIADVETAVASALKTAGIKKADEVEFFEGSSKNGTAAIDGKRAQGRMYCSQLSQLFGVPLWGDYFGKSGYPGDGFMGPAMQQSGGLIPLG